MMDRRSNALPPTLMDIARACKVSKGTVSKALSRLPGRCDLSRRTRDRIRLAARSLGWEAPAQRQRKMGSSVALVYGTPAPFVDGIYEHFADTVANALAEEGVPLLFLPLWSSTDWKRRLRAFPVSGLVIMDPMPHGLDAILEQQGIPAVLVNVRSQLRIPQIIPDDEGGTCTLLDHLRDLRHEQIGWVHHRGFAHHFSAFARLTAYRMASKRQGAAERICSWSDEDELARWLISERRSGMTAVAASNQRDALAVLRLARTNGIRVPEDLSLASADDNSALSLCSPSVTAMHIDMIFAGRIAARRILSMLDHPDDPLESLLTCLPETLQVRESTRCIHHGDRP